MENKLSFTHVVWCIFPLIVGIWETGSKGTPTFHRECAFFRCQKIVSSLSSELRQLCPLQHISSHLIVPTLLQHTKRRGSHQTNTTFGSNVVKAEMAWEVGGVRKEVKGNSFYLTYKGPTSPPSLSKAPGALSWRFVLVHSPTQLMENWAEYLTLIWSMFPCNTLFKIGQIDPGSGSKSTKKSLPFYHLISVVITTEIDLWTAQWQESFRTLFRLEGIYINIWGGVGVGCPTSVKLKIHI